MALIPLTSGFSVLSEGTHILKITAVSYKQDFGKLEISMISEKGEKHTERYNLLSADGSTNEKACNAFSYFAKTAMNDFDRETIDPQELVGKFIEADVIHEKVESRTEPGKMLTFARITEKRVSSGWSEPTPAPAEKKKVDLKALLG